MAAQEQNGKTPESKPAEAQPAPPVFQSLVTRSVAFVGLWFLAAAIIGTAAWKLGLLLCNLVDTLP